MFFLNANITVSHFLIGIVVNIPTVMCIVQVGTTWASMSLVRTLMLSRAAVSYSREKDSSFTSNRPEFKKYFFNKNSG